MESRLPFCSFLFLPLLRLFDATAGVPAVATVSGLAVATIGGFDDSTVGGVDDATVGGFGDAAADSLDAVAMSNILLL